MNLLEYISEMSPTQLAIFYMQIEANARCIVSRLERDGVIEK